MNTKEWIIIYTSDSKTMKRKKLRELFHKKKKWNNFLKKERMLTFMLDTYQCAIENILRIRTDMDCLHFTLNETESPPELLPYSVAKNIQYKNITGLNRSVTYLHTYGKYLRETGKNSVNFEKFQKMAISVT